MQPSASRHSALYAAARVFRTAMHLAVLAGSCVLVFMITVDCLRNVSFLADDRYLHVQFWICLLFMADIILDFFFTRRKWHYLLANLFFFVICIPYLNIINAVGLKLSGEWMFVLRVVPLVRAAFVLAFMTGSFSRARARSMLTAYLALLLMVVYFSSVMFFVEEHAVNPLVHSFRSAIYWAVMNMTTTGCQIEEMTEIGKALAALLSAMGLILFPVFTVYVMDFVGGAPPSSSADV